MTYAGGVWTQTSLGSSAGGVDFASVDLSGDGRDDAWIISSSNNTYALQWNGSTWVKNAAFAALLAANTPTNVFTDYQATIFDRDDDGLSESIYLRRNGTKDLMIIWNGTTWIKDTQFESLQNSTLTELSSRNHG